MKTAAKKKTGKSMKSKAAKSVMKSSEKLRKAAIAEIGERIKTLDKPAKASKPATPKRTSALDAAAQVLSSTNDGMTAKDLIASMANRGLWISPGGKTPHATLYAAIVREIQAKGKDARFIKTERGHFAFNDRQPA